MKKIESDIPISPRTILRELNTKAQEIDNKLIKVQRRERDPSPSFRNLYGQEFNDQLKDKWQINLNKLNEIINQGKPLYEETSIIQPEESLEVRKDYETLADRLNQYKQLGINPRTKLHDYIDVVDDIGRHSQRIEGAALKNRDYSPTNLLLNEQDFLEKAAQDIKKESKEGKTLFDKNEKFLTSPAIYGKDFEKVETYSKTLNEHINRFMKYYEEEPKKVINIASDINNKIYKLFNLQRSINTGQKYPELMPRWKIELDNLASNLNLSNTEMDFMKKLLIDTNNPADVGKLKELVSKFEDYYRKNR